MVLSVSASLTLLHLPCPPHCGWCQPLSVRERASSRHRCHADWIWNRDLSSAGLANLSLRRFHFSFTPSATPICWPWLSNRKGSALDRSEPCTTNPGCEGRTSWCFLHSYSSY